ncbi:VTT domain-containing protein [Furfurilactobacillus sp. WILCCON 0119]|uniref:VTT domain-containing protein n=1 Tax=Furfurilactobacillus entadae TaxID=2922307 RepID=UPI0035F0D61B
MDQLIHIISHLQDYVVPLFSWLGNWSYVTLFLLIFAETGLVVFPWLPGESLIFVTSAIAAATQTSLDIKVLIPIFFFAAVLGDTLNFRIGMWLLHFKFIERHLHGGLVRGQAFFKRYGGRAVIFGRFVPLIRTFVPLLAGSTKMNERRFAVLNVIGVALWVTVGSVLGYYFGRLPFVQAHFAWIFLAVALIGIVPGFIMGAVRYVQRHSNHFYEP